MKTRYKKRFLLLSLFIFSSIAYGDPPYLDGEFEKYSVKGRINQLDSSIIQDKNDSYSYFQRSALYFKQKQYNKALDDINTAINLIDKYYYLRSGIYEVLNEMTNALDDIEKAIELDPQNILFYEKRANIKFNRDDIAGAIKDVTYLFDLLFSSINSSDEDGSIFSEKIKQANDAILNDFPVRSRAYINNLENLNQNKIAFELYKLGIFYSCRQEK